MAHPLKRRGFARVGALALLGSLAAATSACGRLDRECRALSTRANAFIEENGRHPLKLDASPEENARESLVTAARYERLAADLAAIDVQSSELRPEVDAYRALAERAASSLRAVAKSLADKDFDTARRKRVELDTASKGEGPLVARINSICGLSAPKTPASAGSTH